MNEQIRLLADEAAKFSAIMALLTGESGDKLFVVKFAELIVKECANRATWAQDTGEKDIGGEILKHFGVEE
jgi:hypothetical protein